VTQTAVDAPSRSPQLATRESSSSHHVRPSVALFGVLGVAVVLRFSTLGLQSYWSDEAVTVDLVRRSLGQMLSAIPNGERTPPIYYVVAWLWSQVFGTSEVGLRSLSAAFGTLTVLLAYVIARRIAGERAGLIAGSLSAVGPILVWYSQEARSYELLVFLCAASVWLWLRAKETPSTARILTWATVACLAIATHYFASFIVLFEVVSLLSGLERSRVLWAALAIMAIVQAALVPLAVHQARAHEGPSDYITATSLPSRIIAVPKRFLLGEHGAPGATALFAVVLVGLLGIAAWLFVTRVGPESRRRAAPLIVLAVAAAALPLALALVGVDFFAYRNLLAVWVLLAIVAAIALSPRSSRLAALAAAGLVAVFLTLTVAVDVTPGLQRADWRFSPTALGHPTWARLIVITPNFEADPFRIYIPSARFFSGRRIVVREVDLVGYRIPPGRHPPRLGRGFRHAGRVDHQKLSFVRDIAPSPVAIDVTRVHGLAVGSRAFLVQPGR
jgi:mannosyltransferase